MLSSTKSLSVTDRGGSRKGEPPSATLLPDRTRENWLRWLIRFMIVVGMVGVDPWPRPDMRATVDAADAGIKDMRVWLAA